nr:toxin-antitoxin system HicB family antitoxin [Maliibacterium massiliense]
MERRHISLRIGHTLHEQLRYMAAYHGHSMNAYILQLLRRAAETFEQKHGPIPIPPPRAESVPASAPQRKR